MLVHGLGARPPAVSFLQRTPDWYRVMPFEIDVFVSYAHIDDQAMVEGQTGWIANFHRALEIRLAQLLGKEPRIFRDPKLQGNEVFSESLIDRLPKAALLVSVLSPRYVRSDWCTRELREFLRASEATGGARVADKVRVFKVVKTPIPLEDHPKELQEVLGYDFYTIERDTGRPRELTPGAPPEIDRQYWARLDDLAHDIADLLRSLEPKATPGAGNGNGAGTGMLVEAGEPREAVYLAEASFDVKEQRDLLKRELLEHGYRILPDRPLPLVAAECVEMIQAQLAAARLSIHLVGHNYGVIPEGATHSQAELQHQLAVDHASRHGDFPRLIWLPPDLELEDERQQLFLERLTTDPRSQEGADLLRASLEDFKLAVHRRLAPPEPREAEEADASRDDLMRIYLVCDERDVEALPPLEDHLFDQGYEVIVPVFEGDEVQVRKDHEESLVLCDAVLLYYGAGNELWLRRKLREIQKSAGFGRKSPLSAKAVYVAPPEDPRKQRLRTHEALVLQGGETFDPHSLEPFLAELETHRRIHR